MTDISDDLSVSGEVSAVLAPGKKKGKGSSTKARISKLDQFNSQDKRFLSPEQFSELHQVESAIFNADLESLNHILHKYKDRPEDIKRIMEVVVKDLADAGIRASYEVDFAMTSGRRDLAERTGMFDMSTAFTSADWISNQSTLICFYTNPGSQAWAHLELPVRANKRALRAPVPVHIPAEQGLKEIAASMKANLEKRQ